MKFKFYLTKNFLYLIIININLKYIFIKLSYQNILLKFF